MEFFFLNLKMIGSVRLLTFQCLQWSPRRQEVMIDTPAASLQRGSGTKEQKTNMKLMSKALGFCLWSCIGVISEEGPCPCTSLLSTPHHHHPRRGLAWGGSGQLTWGNGRSGRSEYVPREDGVRSHGRLVARWTRELWCKEAFLASWLSPLS